MMIKVTKIIHTLLTYTIILLEYHWQKIISTVEFRDHSLKRAAHKNNSEWNFGLVETKNMESGRPLFFIFI